MWPHHKRQETANADKNLLEVKINDDIVEKLSVVETVEIFVRHGNAARRGRRRIREQPDTSHIHESAAGILPVSAFTYSFLFWNFYILSFLTYCYSTVVLSVWMFSKNERYQRPDTSANTTNRNWCFLQCINTVQHRTLNRSYQQGVTDICANILHCTDLILIFIALSLLFFCHILYTVFPPSTEAISNADLSSRQLAAAVLYVRHSEVHCRDSNITLFNQHR